uniref:long-chain-fatty-acid--CoA ligase n=1 Tax=Hydra vulgaris TaxID=6087 RepID=T2MBA0_HYDVU
MYRLVAFGLLGIFGLLFINLPWLLTVACVSVLYLITGGWKWVRLFYLTIGRDIKIAKVILGIEINARKLLRQKKTIADIFQENAAKNPDKYIFESIDTGEKITYRQAAVLSNKMANIFFEAGYRKGDVVGLLMENCVEYIPIWIGLTQIGIVVSLMNYNLRGESLKHCFISAECKAVIYSLEMDAVLSGISSQMNIEYYCYGSKVSSINNSKHLNTLLASAAEYAPPKPLDLSLQDKMIFIFTSGTTGLPKAAVIRGTRFYFMASGIGGNINATSEDKVYNTLPMYHSNGGIAIACFPILFSATMIIRKKFSASKFFEDCYKSEATVINYIGETCRYLLATPVVSFESQHKVRVAVGNGLRASIWTQFTSRFNIPLIAEFYGSTEGNANMINVCNRVGAVGFSSVLLPRAYPIKLVKVNKETGEIIRGSNGLAVSPQCGEPGELCGKIRKDVVGQFDGYLNKESTQKKIAHDIFSKGDSVFMTGDVLIQDEEGFFYFQDRLGDTFRWKGENVSTNEVEGIMTNLLNMTEVCVYGVEIPGNDGKAGMAIINDPNRKVNIDSLPQQLGYSLPEYARPVFIRLSHQIPKTTTFKFQKEPLRDAGFNPSKCYETDSLFYFSSKDKKYIPLDMKVYQNILDMNIRF